MKAQPPEVNASYGHSTYVSSSQLTTLHVGGGSSGSPLGPHQPASHSKPLHISLLRGLADVTHHQGSNSAPSTCNVGATTACFTEHDGGHFAGSLVFNTDMMDFRPSCVIDDHPDDADMLVFESGDNAYLELLASDPQTVPAPVVPMVGAAGEGCGVYPEVVTAIESAQEGTAQDCVGGGAPGIHYDGNNWTSDGFIPNQNGGSGGAFSEMDEVGCTENLSKNP